MHHRECCSHSKHSDFPNEFQSKTLLMNPIILLRREKIETNGAVSGWSPLLSNPWRTAAACPGMRCGGKGTGLSSPLCPGPEPLGCSLVSQDAHTFSSHCFVSPSAALSAPEHHVSCQGSFASRNNLTKGVHSATPPFVFNQCLLGCLDSFIL